jgi:single-strand DNA-binding protein
MPGSVNKAILIGHLGADAEVRTTQNGNKVGQFNLATSESWRDKATGERKERTQWHRVVVFSEPLIDAVVAKLKKGAKVYVEGQIETRDWTDQGGTKRYVTEIVLRGFHSAINFLDRAPGVPAPGDDEATAGRNFGAAAAKPSTEIDDEIPF